MEIICRRIKAGGHLGSYGALDGATGGRILQQLADKKVLNPHMLAAFRGCPITTLALDKNPRTTNALLVELGRKVWCGVLKNADMLSLVVAYAQRAVLS